MQGKTYEMHDDFSLYIATGQTANHALPRDILDSPTFHDYRVSKKYFLEKVIIHCKLVKRGFRVHSW